MNEELEEGERHLLLVRDLGNGKSWQHFALLRFFCSKNNLANIYLLVYTQTDFSCPFFFFLFETCFLNITRFFFFITSIVKVIEEFLVLGCSNFHRVFVRLYKGDVLLLSLGAQGIWLHSCDKGFIK